MGTIVVANTNDSGIGSLRNAVDDSTRVILKNLIIANGTGVSQDESAESGGKDTLTGEDYSEASLYNTINTGDGNDTFRSTLGTIDTGNGDDKFLIGGYSELHPIFEIITLPPPKPFFQFNGFPGLSAIQRSQEAEPEFSGASSSNGAWALGSTFELSSGVPFFSQTGTSAGIYMPVGAEHVDTWGNS